jgi:hypothetical protein
MRRERTNNFGISKETGVGVGNSFGLSKCRDRQ